MDRRALKNLTHNAKDFLSVGKGDYKQWVFRYTFLELEKDLAPNGDITTMAVLEEGLRGKGVVSALEDGVVAGLAELKYFLVDSDPRFRPSVSALAVNFLKEDGDKVVAGEKVLEIEGLVKDVLAIERVSLNLLMRMSGVATYTRKLVGLIEGAGLDTLLVPTRKTLWGLLDKRAVVVGGGGTHRLNLSDAILIKDNHLSLLGGSVSSAIKNVAGNSPDARFIEVEVENEAIALKAAEALVNFVSHGQIESPACVMFDNMKAGEIVAALDEMKSKGYYDQVLFEASGGINEENLVEYAKTGVDIISMGALTMSARALDFSLELLAQT